MELVQELNDIHGNIRTLDAYLQDQELKDFAMGLIKRGTCFIAVKKDQGYSFYPSRFIGYTSNNHNAHIHNEEKDGRDTNPAISEILGCKPMPSEEFEEEYKRFCDTLGFVANANGNFGVKRKYWTL